MLRLRLLMKNNKITIKKLAIEIGLSEDDLGQRLLKKYDFKIKELEDIKEYFVRERMLHDDFDIGEFLEEISS